jgi:hypothetical protein
MSVATNSKLPSPATSRTKSISSSVGVGLGITHHADGLADALGETLRDADALGDCDNEADELALAEADELGETEWLGETDWLTVVNVTVCHRPSASTTLIPPAIRIQMEPLP